MRNLLILTALITLAFVLACAKPEASTNVAAVTPDPNYSPAPVYSAPEAVTQDDAPRISLVDAKKDFDDGSAVFIDTRADTVYRQEHIRGAINITSETLKDKIKDLPKNKTLIAYCS
jgi:Rhodanese-like domain